MLFVLTALVILPNDAADLSATNYRTRIGKRIVLLEKQVEDWQKEVTRCENALRTLPADSPKRVGHSNRLSQFQFMLNKYRMELDHAEQADLRGPPFANAVWRVETAPKK